MTAKYFAPAESSSEVGKIITPPEQSSGTASGGVIIQTKSDGKIDDSFISDAIKTPETTIYNGDSTLTGDRRVSLGGHFLSFGNNNIFIARNGNIGFNTANPTSNFTLVQSGTGANRGFRFTGMSIGGTSSGSGFLYSLGYNVNGNKQMWYGDPDYIGNNDGTFVRIASGGGKTYIDAVNGLNNIVRPLWLDATGSGKVMIGSANNPTEELHVSGSIRVTGGYRDSNNSFGSNGQVLTSTGSGTKWDAPSDDSIKVGDYILGGVVCYVDSSGHGLIVSMQYKADKKWDVGDTAHSPPTTNLIIATQKSVFAGMRNTERMINKLGSAAEAAIECYNTNDANFGDWFLPSVEDFQKLYNNRNVVNSALTSNSGAVIANDNHWTSTEFNAGNSYIFRMSNGSYAYVLKSVNHKVRPFRKF